VVVGDVERLVGSARGQAAAVAEATGTVLGRPVEFA
jgi:hypothetical protein